MARVTEPRQKYVLNVLQFGKTNGFESIEHFRSGELFFSGRLNAVRIMENSFAQFKNHWH